jgi:hypothetical protein
MSASDFLVRVCIKKPMHENVDGMIHRNVAIQNLRGICPDVLEHVVNNCGMEARLVFAFQSERVSRNERHSLSESHAARQKTGIAG